MCKCKNHTHTHTYLDVLIGRPYIPISFAFINMYKHTLLTLFLHTHNMRPCGIVANRLDCIIEVNEFNPHNYN